MNDITLYRIDPQKNMRRFYHLAVQQDLFGCWTVLREWGRIGRHGQTQLRSYSTEDEARLDLRRQLRAKEQRGYVAAVAGST